MLTCIACVCISHSVVSDSATPWTVACQALLSMDFSRHEYWSGFPPPGIFLIQESNPGFLHSGRFFTVWATREDLHALWIHRKDSRVQWFPHLVDLRTHITQKQWSEEHIWRLPLDFVLLSLPPVFIPSPVMHSQTFMPLNIISFALKLFLHQHPSN